MRNIFLLTLLLFIWIFGGIWYYHQCCCSGHPINLDATSVNALRIEDGTYFNATASSNIVFEAQQTDHTMTQEVVTAFEQTSTYLQQHPTKVLFIETPANDLEQQRGQVIANYLRDKYPIHPSQIQVATTTKQQWDYRFDASQPLVIKGPSKRLECFDNFVFESSNFALAVPPSKALDDLLKQVAVQLKDHPSKQLDIVGHYLASEENNSSAVNLGKARANQIRSILIEKHGVSPSQLTYSGHQVSHLTTLQQHPSFKNDLLIGPIDFVFSQQTIDNASTETAERLERLEKDLLITPRRLYFETGKNKLIIDDRFRAYFEDVIFYLENTPTAFIECSGHTDNQGDEAKNLILSKERAAFVAEYFAQQRIPVGKIKTISSGEQYPIKSNATAKGRAKNRRVEILVKKP